MVLVIQADAAELLDDLREGRLLGREIEQHVALGGALQVELLEADQELVEARRLAEVHVLVDDARGELGPDVLVDRQHARVLRESPVELVAEGVVGIRPAPHADQHEFVGQQVGPPQLVERRHHLAVRKIARRAEQDEDERIGHALEPQSFAQRIDQPRGTPPPPVMREPLLADRGVHLLGPWCGSRRFGQGGGSRRFGGRSVAGTGDRSVGRVLRDRTVAGRVHVSPRGTSGG